MARAGNNHKGGRKPGSTTRKSRKLADKIATDGEATPLEVLIGNMRYYWSEVGKLMKELEATVAADEKMNKIMEMMGMREKASNEAVRAANYVHPKLANVVYKGEAAKPTEVEDAMDPVAAAEAYASTLNHPTRH